MVSQICIHGNTVKHYFHLFNGYANSLILSKSISFDLLSSGGNSGTVRDLARNRDFGIRLIVTFLLIFRLNRDKPVVNSGETRVSSKKVLSNHKSLVTFSHAPINIWNDASETEQMVRLQVVTFDLKTTRGSSRMNPFDCFKHFKSINLDYRDRKKMLE